MPNIIDEDFDERMIARIARRIAYGQSIEEIREDCPRLSDEEFFLAYQAALTHHKWLEGGEADRIDWDRD